MRNNGVSLDEDFPDMAFSPVNSVLIDRRSPEQAAKELDDVLTWLRNDKDEVDDPQGDFKRVDQMLPRKKGQTLLERAHDIDNALIWIRTREFHPPSMTKTCPAFRNLTPFMLPEGARRIVKRILITL